jgi:AcrR family transcriptional regulator
MANDGSEDRRLPGRPKNPVPREKLIDVARQQFAAGGFAGTSMNDIAQNVGVRKSSLFHHFDSKNKLYQEVVLGIVRQLSECVRDAAAFEGSYGERLDKLSTSVTDFLASQPFAALLVVREALDEHLFVEAEGRALLGDALERVARLLEAGMKDRVLVRDDPRQVAVDIISFLLLPFAAGGVVSRFLGADLMTGDALAARRKAVASHVRRICGLGDSD